MDCDYCIAELLRYFPFSEIEVGSAVDVTAAADRAVVIGTTDVVQPFRVPAQTCTKKWSIKIIKTIMSATIDGITIEREEARIVTTEEAIQLSHISKR